MTNDRYHALYAQARAQWGTLTMAQLSQLKKVYEEAAKEAAAVVKDARLRNLSDLTVQSWSSIEAQLEHAAQAIAQAVQDGTQELITKSYQVIAQIDKQYLMDASRRAQLDLFTESGLDAMYRSINTRVVNSAISRMYQDGYTFSKRVWGGYNQVGEPTSVKSDWQYRIKMIVSAGLAQGRDPVKIARDIQAYTKGGKVQLAKRWGNLVAGTPEFSKRIPKGIDWRAVRLVRTEQYNSIREASILQAKSNPACTGKVDWVLSPGRFPWPCGCLSLAERSPYTIEAANAIMTHPNCFCRIVPRLEDANEFMARLKAWGAGAIDEGLEAWYYSEYLPVQGY